MSYLQARSDLRFMQDFKQDVEELWEVEDEAASQLTSGQRRQLHWQVQAAVQGYAQTIPGYGEVRTRVVRGALRANGIALGLNVPIGVSSLPPPGIPGPRIDLSLFSAVIRDNTYVGVGRQAIVDALDQTTGACEAHLHAEKLKLMNPLHWIKAGLIFVIRIPFILFEASGFDVSKVEDHFIGRAFKLVYILVLIAILVRWFGVTKEELLQAITALL